MGRTLARVGDGVLCYIIKANDGSFYVGITGDLIGRWKAHKSHYSSYFKKRIPIEVVWVKGFGSYKDARRMELAIKRKGALKFLLSLRFRVLEKSLYI